MSWYWCSLLVWTGGWVALEEWKLKLTSVKVEVEVEAELGNSIKIHSADIVEWENCVGIHWTRKCCDNICLTLAPLLLVNTSN